MLTDAVSHAPALVTLVFLVIAFLKYLTAEGESNRKAVAALFRSIEEEGARNRAALKEVSLVIARIKSSREG